jgi:hypothetical protein
MTMNERYEDRDELASAYLDGELDPVERAVVEDDPDLLRTVATFEALGNRIATGVDPPAGSFDAALDAAHAELDPDTSRAAVNNVIPLRRRRFGALAGLGAAAAAVVGIIVVTGPLSDNEDDSQTTIAAAEFEESALESSAGDLGLDAADEPGDESASPDPNESASQDAASADHDEGDSFAAASPRRLADIGPATLLIEIDRITKRLDLLQLEALDADTLGSKLLRSLKDCGFEGDVVLVDSIDEIEVVVIDSGEPLGLILIPESCEVITKHVIG